MTFSRYVFLIIVIFEIVNCSSANIDPEIDEFIANYLPGKHMPQICNNTVLQTLDLVQILGIDELQETVTVSLILQQAYFLNNGAHLAWNFSQDLAHFFPKSGSVWSPDIIYLNSIMTEKSDSALIVVAPSYMSLCMEDESIEVPAIMLSKMSTEVLSCSLDVEEYPFDEQVCSIDMGPCFTSNDPENFQISTAGATELPLANYMPSSQWKMLQTWIGHGTRNQARKDFTVDLQTISYKFKVKRQPMFYVYTLVIPSSLLVILSVLCIAIPVESGEKISLAITIMLSQMVNLLILSSLIPASSIFPKIGLFSVASIFMLAFVLLFCCIEISVHSETFESPPPNWIFRLFNSALAPALCVSRIKSKVEDEREEKLAGNLNGIDKSVNEILAVLKGMNEKDSANVHWDLVFKVIKRIFLLGYCVTVIGVHFILI